MMRSVAVVCFLLLAPSSAFQLLASGSRRSLRRPSSNRASPPVAILDLHSALPMTDALALFPWEVPYDGSVFEAEESKRSLTGLFDDYTIIGLLAVGFPTAITLLMYGNPMSDD